MQISSRHIFILFFLLSVSMTAFSQQKNEYLRKSFQKKLDDFLVRSQEIADYISITDFAVNIYASPQDKQQNTPEYVVSWEELSVFRALLKQQPDKAFEYYEQGIPPIQAMDFLKRENKQSGLGNNPERPLEGIRVALDPGHSAWNLKQARWEQRMVKFKLDGTKILFNEAYINWCTAKILKYKLIQLGAEVFMTREKVGLTAFGIPYDEWLKNRIEQEKNGFIDELIGETVFRESKKGAQFKAFLKIELEERARQINQFQPDMTIVIHYNGKSGTFPIEENTTMSFVGGSFMQGELVRSVNRFHLLRLLLTEDIENSIDFCDYIMNSFDDVLQVPRDDDYNPGTVLPTEVVGVYARNLALTRWVHGIICYGETLYQDNIIEAERLNDTSLDVPEAGVYGTSYRIYEVAEAYLQGIVNYVNNL